MKTKLIAFLAAILMAGAAHAANPVTEVKDSPKRPFVTAGISSLLLDWEFSQYGMSYNPRFNIKFGRSENLLNIVAGAGWKWGADYNRINGIFGYFKNNMSNTWLNYEGFEYQQIQVPVILRLNFVHRPGRTWFIGAGATFNWALSSQYVYKQDMTEPVYDVDKNFLNPTNIEYTVQLGGRRHNTEFFVYFSYYGTSPFNHDYMSSAIPDYYLSNSSYFNNNWSVGITGIMYFALN